VLAGLALAGAILDFRRPRIARGIAVAVASILAVVLGIRWARSGHPAVFGTTEMDLAQALVILLLSPWLARGLDRGYLRAPLAAAAVLLAHTLVLDRQMTPVTISEQSLWIDVHAPLGWLTLALYAHATFLAFRGEPAASMALRALGLAFCAHSAMGFVGVYYASILFARPWQWDPVQTLGLLAWILSGLALHFRLFSGISLHRQRRFVLVVLVSYVLSAKALIYLPPTMSFHVFELGSMR